MCKYILPPGSFILGMHFAVNLDPFADLDFMVDTD